MPHSASEVGYLAGIAATDWSWAPLLSDFNNDGRRDLFVTNGYGTDVTDLDFIRRQEKILAFGTEAAQRETLRDEMDALPEVDRPNYVFENEGDLTFTDRPDAWTNAGPGLSNRAAVADLDNDGDLDVVTNNIDDPATLLENQAEDALPSIRTPGSVVTAADYDGDGQSDLFVGGRVRPGAYPRPPRSHLLRNESDGGTVTFADVTDTAAPGLTKPGLVTAEVGLGETAGWWLSLAAEDIDGDGTPEYVAGNLGRNTRHEASPSARCASTSKTTTATARSTRSSPTSSTGRATPFPAATECSSRFPG